MEHDGVVAAMLSLRLKDCVMLVSIPKLFVLLL